MNFKKFHTRTDYEKGWPDSFDFETYETCQKLFKPFIEEQLKELKEFDEGRPDDITYIFHQHAKRVATDVKNTCLHMGLGDNVANNMYWALLAHDIGKKELPVRIWDTEGKPDKDLKELRRTHTTIGAALVEEHFEDSDHPFKSLMIDIILHHHEQMDGFGTLGISARDISKPAQLAAIVEAFDGWRIWRPHYGDRDITISGVLTKMREEKGAAMFNMELFEAFADMKMEDHKKEK